MKTIKARLIISDFDGTLLTSSHEVPEKVKRSISEYVAAGGVFAVCTGRMLSSILPQVRALGLKGLVAAYQGTVIADIESGQIIKNGGFAVEDCVRICKTLEERGYPINAYADNIMYTDLPEDDKLLNGYEKITGIRAQFVCGQKMSDFIKERGLYCQKIVSVISPEKKLPLYEYLLHKLGADFEVTYSASVLVEVSPKGDDKGQALKYLAAHYGIAMEDTVAIGDNLNDLPMIKAAGVGVAVQNSVPEFKQFADVVCPSCDNGGVAEIIQKYGFA